MDTSPAPARPTAWIILPGHADAPAHLSVQRYSRLARLSRTMWYAFVWMISSVGMLLVSIGDPFLTAIPFFTGAVLTYKTWGGRFRVMEFHGSCPRCQEPIQLKPGSKIGSPHHLVCYNCHHEPDLYLAA
ncbi:hypothetical protein [Longimicrobium sp.]|uniref:hypothetical protein n=1 Tax=Longimicrobium sp. TaxID=2029185 RepID=UPI003B3AF5DB